jgi:hypothetical protein
MVHQRQLESSQNRASARFGAPLRLGGSLCVTHINFWATLQALVLTHPRFFFDSVFSFFVASCLPLSFYLLHVHMSFQKHIFPFLL